MWYTELSQMEDWPGSWTQGKWCRTDMDTSHLLGEALPWLESYIQTAVLGTETAAPTKLCSPLVRHPLLSSPAQKVCMFRRVCIPAEGVHPNLNWTIAININLVRATLGVAVFKTVHVKKAELRIPLEVIWAIGYIILVSKAIRGQNLT